MTFNSYTFFAFFAIVLAFRYSTLSWPTKKVCLLVASYLFYAAWYPPFVVLLVVSTGTDWFAARGAASGRGTPGGRLSLLASLVVNLGMLAFFKYAGFFIGTLSVVLETVGIHYRPVAPDIILPLGISFFTFQSLTYTFDVYRGKLSVWPSFLDFALYVAFFPKLVIGPITRASDFLPQCREGVGFNSSKIAWGLVLLFLGLFEKIVLADSLLAPVADLLFEKKGMAGFTTAWVGSLAYTGQIFFDFAGYSTCAIGAALCLGFVLPENFKYPYGAIGFSDFWRRWHISLSSWLRDYLYISLGGNRKGEARTYINLMVTMLLGGLWHGASWTFVIWGGLHGFYLVAERLIRRWVPDVPLWSKRPAQFFLAAVTFILVSLAWVFFRAKSFPQAFAILGSMFALGQGVASIHIDTFHTVLTLVLIVATLACHWAMRERSLQTTVEGVPWWLRSLILAGMLVAIVTCSGEDRAFIYFQF